MEVVRSASGVAVDGNQGCISITGIPSELTVSKKITEILTSEGVLVDTVSQTAGDDGVSKNILLSVKYPDVDQVLKLLESIKEVCQARSIVAETNVSRISLIGSSLGSEPRFTRELIGTLEEAGIEINSLSTSEMRISCFVPKRDAARASQLLHRTFIQGAEPSKRNIESVDAPLKFPTARNEQAGLKQLAVR